MTAPPEPCDALVRRVLRVPRSERSFLHWILEAHEGLATLTEPPEADGDLVLTVPVGRAAELDALLAELCRELPAVELRGDREI